MEHLIAGVLVGLLAVVMLRLLIARARAWDR